MDDLEALEVSFTANIDDILSAGSAIDDIFASVAESAAASGADMSESMTAAAGSFDSITAAMDELSAMTAEGAAEASASLSSLTEAGDETASSISDSISSISFSSLQDAIDSLANSVTDAVDEINSQIDSIGTTAEDSAASSEAAFSGFDLGGMVSGIGMGIFSLQAIGNVAVQAGQSLLGPAMAAENTQASFTNLLGSTKAATDELGKLNTFAAATEFKTQDIDNAAASMVAFGIPTKTIIPDLTAVGDALTAVGKGTPAEMQSVVDILGKMSVQGKITQGDITQLGSHGINAMAALEQATGLSSTALQSMISKGTLPATQAIADLTSGIEKNPVYAGGMAKQSETLSGQLSTLSSDFDQVMAAALTPALPELEKEFGELTTTLTSPSFKQFAVTLGTDIATGLVDTINGISTLVSDGQQLIDFFKDNQTAMTALEAGLFVLAGVFGGVMISSLAAMAVAAWAAIVQLLPFIAIGAAVGLVVFGIVEAVQHWGEIAHWLQGEWAGVEGFFGGIWSGIQNTFGGIGNWFHDRFQDAANGVQSGADKAKNVFANIGGWFHDRGTDAAAGAKSGYQNVVTMFADTNQQIMNGFQWLYDHNTYVKDMVDDAATASKWLENEATTIYTNVTNFISQKWQWLDREVTSIWTTSTAWLTEQWTSISKKATDEWNYITEVISVATSLVENEIHSIWGNITNHISKVWTETVIMAETAWGDISGVFKSAWSTYIQNPLNDLGNDIAGFWNDIVSGAESIGENIINGVVSGIENMTGAVGNALHNAIGSDLSTLGFHNIPGFAAGTNNAPGGLSLVGEQGPELVNLSSGSQVLPLQGRNAASLLAYSGSSGGGKTHIHVHIGDQELATFVVDPVMNQVVRVLRGQGGGRMVGI